MAQRVDNHFVPQSYLKGWSDGSKKIYLYSLVVSSSSVPTWRLRSIRGVAFHQHLYTRLAAGGESDEIERWLHRDFEVPAQEALNRVREDRPLKAEQWRSLARYVAAQHARTPARFLEQMTRWETDLQDTITTSLQSSVTKLSELKSPIPDSNTPSEQHANEIPMRVHVDRSQPEGPRLGLEVVAGRGLWLFTIRHLLSKTIRALQRHRWFILTSPDGVSWPTSDDPVIPLNYYKPGHYDFKGGWGSKGTEILLPLSPRHLLYTRIGYRQRFPAQVEPRMAAQFTQFIIEHAHRSVFAAKPLPEVARLRPRLVDRDVYTSESELWKRWHEDQTTAERDLGTGGLAPPAPDGA